MYFIFIDLATFLSLLSQVHAFISIIFEMSLGISFFLLVLIIGGIIIVTLSYVAWRKFKGQQKRVMDKKRTKNNSSN